MSPGDRVMDAMRVYSVDYAEMMLHFSRWLGVHTADAAAFAEIIVAQDTGEPLTPVKLSKRIGLTSGATTSLLNRLEDAGLIVRSREHADRRRVTLRVTEDIGRDAKAVFDPVAARLDAMMEQYPVAFLEDVEALLDHLHTVFRDAVQSLQEKAKQPRVPR
jgi:DNA-binding MarR family transcriptional regulator